MPKQQLLPALALATCALAGCAPTVQMQAPDKPITINLNVKIEHDVRVKIDKELDNVMKKDSGLF